MKKGPLLTIALTGFLIGVIVIVFLQVLSGRNINRLMQGNANLLLELRIQKDLRAIEASILGLESDIRGAVIADNATFLGQVDSGIANTTTQVHLLKEALRTPGNEARLLRLDGLVQDKIRFSRQIVQAYNNGGKKAAEAVINTARGMALRDSIIIVLSELDSARQTATGAITRQFEQSGRQARTWGFALALLACMMVVLAFWYIVAQSQQQQKIIHTLNESERKIKDAAQMKEQFMTNMSHEIRTPMNAIIGFTNLLRRTRLDTTQREYVQNIHSAGDNLLALINDILDLSKIEAGMMHMEETRFSVRSLAASVSAMFAEKMAEKKLRYYTDIADDVPDILSGDAIRLTQVLVNLLGNAVKFTARGEIGLLITCRYEQGEKVGLRFTVRDTGIGIPPEKQHSIFERFQQAEAATTRRYGGTGLGLSIVRQLVTIQGGSVAVESKVGKGSSFIVDIDYRIPDISEITSSSVLEDDVAMVPESVQLLIAEDNSMNQQLIRHLMRNWGFGFTIVSNGVEAIEILKRQPFLLVLMDIQMPEMDGYITTTVIRNELKLDIPVIAMTAHAMMGEKEKCLQLGMNDYLSKPIKENELYNIIAHYAQLEARRQDASANAAPVQKQYQFVNLEYLHQLSGNDAGFEREMMQQFCSQAATELAALQAAVATEDFQNIKSIAHSLKSTMGYMGLHERVNPYLSTIEQAAKAASTSSITGPLQAVNHIATETVREVNEIMQESQHQLL